MTIEQQRLEDIAYTETRVREEMQKYIVAANNRADKAEQEAANAKQKNIASIIGICRDVNFSDEQTIKQLIEKASLTREEAIKALNEY